MERSEILAAMSELKLYGMKAAFEWLRQGRRPYATLTHVPGVPPTLQKNRLPVLST